MLQTQRVAWNAVLMLAKQGVMAVLSVVFVGFLARSVGVAAWGELQASIALCAMASIIAGLGVRGYVAREIAVRPELGPRHLGSALMIRGLMGAVILSIIATATCSMHPSSEARWLVPIAAASQLATLLYTTMWLSFEAHEQFKYILYVELVARLFVLACASICVAAGLGILSAAIVFAVGNVIELVLTYYFLSSRLYAPRLSADFFELLSIAKRSLPIGFAGALFGAVRQSDRVLLRWFGDETAVGIFSAGYVLVEQLELVSDLLFGAAFAAGMRLYARDRESFHELYSTAFVVAVALGLPMAAGVCLLAPDIIQLVYGGREFAGAVHALRILAWHVPTMFAYHVAAMPLLAGKREAHLGAVLLPALVVIVGMDWILVPAYGAVGAATTALVVATGVLIALLAITPSCVRVVPVQRVRSAIISTVLMALVVHFVREPLGMWAAIVAGASTYAALLFALRVVTTDDVRGLVRPATAQFHRDEPCEETASKRA
ncbi:MAG: flippase [Polyangiaceae bacterium]|nr:flippase [Polyangiaceae bacterium]